LDFNKEEAKILVKNQEQSRLGDPSKAGNGRKPIVNHRSTVWRPKGANTAYCTGQPKPVTIKTDKDDQTSATTGGPTDQRRNGSFRRALSGRRVTTILLKK